jgi:hypothetical protein
VVLVAFVHMCFIAAACGTGSARAGATATTPSSEPEPIAIAPNVVTEPIRLPVRRQTSPVPGTPEPAPEPSDDLCHRAGPTARAGVTNGVAVCRGPST